MYDNVVTGATNFVVDTATQLRDDPAALAATTRQGIVDVAQNVAEGVVNSNIVVANTFTFGLIPGLNNAADDLVSHNNFYRVVQIGAVIGREFAIGAITGGAAKIAIGGAARLFGATALRMGVSAGRIACMATNAQRIMAPIQAFNNVSTLISNASAIQAAYARGDYETAAVLVARSAGMVRGTVSSLRETGRLVSAGTQALTGNPDALRGYLTNCFAAGTPVLGEGGSKPIEDYRPGDLLWARDENNPDAPAELKPIEERFVSEQPLWHLHIGNKVIRTTFEHPFWVKGRGWTPLNEMIPGDVLIGKDGEESVVREIGRTGEVERVYNFRVADHHTYFVGGEAWGFDVWAHNECVYISRDSTGVVNYVGITKNYAARESAHLRAGLGVVPAMVTGLSSLTRAEARAVEQVLIEHFGRSASGGTLLNKINSISPSNPIYSTAKSNGTTILRHLGLFGF